MIFRFAFFFILIQCFLRLTGIHCIKTCPVRKTGYNCTPDPGFFFYLFFLIKGHLLTSLEDLEYLLDVLIALQNSFSIWVAPPQFHVNVPLLMFTKIFKIGQEWRKNQRNYGNIPNVILFYKDLWLYQGDRKTILVSESGVMAYGRTSNSNWRLPSEDRACD